jgi:cell division septation protein DedD
VQNVIDAALKQLQAGRADQAVQALSGAVAGGNLPPAIMAKALYVRGVAYRRQGRSAQAISDLNAALWLKGGLGGDDRSEAINERAAAYADAGLADPGGGQGAASKAAASNGSNWLSGLFNGFSGASEPPPRPPPPPRASPPPVVADDPPPLPAGKAAAATSGWSSTPQAEEPPRAPAAKAPPPPRAQPARVPPPAAPPEAPARRAEGRYLVQLAAMRTEAEALALAAKAKREHAAVLAGRAQSIDQKVFGNMGAFYRARFGPFASAQETQAVCAKLQGSGIDCLPISQ